jgi:hypothetical protein
MTRRRGFIVSVMAAYVLARPLAALAQCPSSHVDDVLNDPVVQDALDRAWDASDEGTPGEHEEGGDIYQCREANADGSYSYRTEIRPWPPGTSEGIAPSRTPTMTGPCRFVATYHTHPGGAGDDGNDNHLPSGDDEHGSANEGVPGIIRWGHDGDTHDFTYGYNRMTGPRDPSWRCPDERPDGRRGGGGTSGDGSTTGEPHLQSLDGLRFDFQTIGDFLLVRSAQGDFELQVRQLPYRNLTHVSLNGAIVVRDGFDRIEWALGRTEPLLNGKPRAIGDGEVVRLRSHAVLRRGDTGYVLITAAGDRVSVAMNGPYIDARIVVAPRRKGTMSGLLGNFDGNEENDVMTAGGRAVAPPAHNEIADYTHPLYSTFGASWRVPPARSLFSTPFSSTADPNVFPARMPRPTEAAMTAASDKCAARGIVDAIARANCAFDVAVTGDEAFIPAAVPDGPGVRTGYAVPLDAPPPAAPPIPEPTAAGATTADRDVSGRLARADERVEYVVELNRGPHVFDARGSNGTSWTLMTPDRKSLFNTNQSTYMGQYPVRLELARAGPHVITVAVQPGKPSGEYRFRVRSVPQVPPKSIAMGEDVTGRIASIGEQHVYRLQFPRGTFAFESIAAENTAWTLISPNGRSLFDGNQQEFMHSVPSIALPPGRYTLTVRGRAILGVGAYRFRVVQK